MAKKVWVAVTLNLFLYGLGYVYLGKKKVFGLILFVGNLAFYAAFVYALLFPLPQSVNLYVNINSVGFGIVSLAFAYDAYRLAKETG